MVTAAPYQRLYFSVPQNECAKRISHTNTGRSEGHRAPSWYTMRDLGRGSEVPHPLRQRPFKDLQHITSRMLPIILTHKPYIIKDIEQSMRLSYDRLFE